MKQGERPEEPGPEAVREELRQLVEGLEGTARSLRRVELEPDNVRQGLAQLVLTLVKLIHELLEREAIRRMEGGSLSDEEIERLGQTLMLQAEELERLREVFGLEEGDLNLDLGPLGRVF